MCILLYLLLNNTSSMDRMSIGSMWRMYESNIITLSRGYFLAEYLTLNNMQEHCTTQCLLTLRFIMSFAQVQSYFFCTESNK